MESLELADQIRKLIIEGKKRGEGYPTHAVGRLLRRLLTPAPNREAELKVIEAAKKNFNGCSKYDHLCGYCDLGNELGDALADLTAAERGQP